MKTTIPIALAVATFLLAPGESRAQPTALATIEQRETAVWEAALREPGRLKGDSPMHYWVAQHLFKESRDDEAVRIVSDGVGRMRAFIEKREKAGSTNIGANGFLYWASLDCYVRWHRRFPQSLLDDYRYVFTHARNYKGTTGNLSMIHTLSVPIRSSSRRRPTAANPMSAAADSMATSSFKPPS